MTEMIVSTSLSQVLDNAVATGAMTLLVNREFKTSKNGDSASLKKWLKIKGDIDVHAVVTDNGVLVVGAYYDIDVIKLLNVDFQFHFHSGTMTYMWTNSESKTPSVGSKK